MHEILEVSWAPLPKLPILDPTREAAASHAALHLPRISSPFYVFAFLGVPFCETYHCLLGS